MRVLAPNGMPPKAGLPPKPNKDGSSKKDGKNEAGSVEDRINLHQLMELKAAFDRADIDGGGSLDMDEFLEAFGEVLGKNLTHEQLTHLFMKIDANSDGSVDWDEFTNYIIEKASVLNNVKHKTDEIKKYTHRRVSLKDISKPIWKVIYIPDHNLIAYVQYES